MAKKLSNTAKGTASDMKGIKQEKFDAKDDAGNQMKARAGPVGSVKGKASKADAKAVPKSESQEIFNNAPANVSAKAEEKSRKVNQEYFDKGLKSKKGKTYDAFLQPEGVEPNSYTNKDGEDKSGYQFKFSFEFPERKKGE